MGPSVLEVAVCPVPPVPSAVHNNPAVEGLQTRPSAVPVAGRMLPPVPPRVAGTEGQPGRRALSAEGPTAALETWPATWEKEAGLHKGFRVLVAFGFEGVLGLRVWPLGFQGVEFRV